LTLSPLTNNVFHGWAFSLENNHRCYATHVGHYTSYLWRFRIPLRSM